MWVEGYEHQQSGGPAIAAAVAGIAVAAGTLAGAGSESAAIAIGTVVAAATWFIMTGRARRERQAMADSIPRIHVAGELDLPEGEAAVLEVVHLRDRLGASQSEVVALEDRLRLSEARSAEAARLLADIGHIALPELHRVAETWRAALDRNDTGLDRRGEAGAMLASMRRIETLIADVLALGEAEIPAPGHRPVPTEIATIAAAAVGENGRVFVDATLPRLVSCDKPTFELFVNNLVEHARRRGAKRPSIRITGIPCAGSLWAITFEFAGFPDVPHQDLALLGAANPGIALQEYGHDRGFGLTLALAARALRRLGGRVVPQSTSAEAGMITVEIVVAQAIDRRALAVVPDEAAAEQQREEAVVTR